MPTCLALLFPKTQRFANFENHCQASGAKDTVGTLRVRPGLKGGPLREDSSAVSWCSGPRTGTLWGVHKQGRGKSREDRIQPQQTAACFLPAAPTTRVGQELRGVWGETEATEAGENQPPETRHSANLTLRGKTQHRTVTSQKTQGKP